MSMGSGPDRQLATDTRSRQLGGRLRHQRVISDRIGRDGASLPAARPDGAMGLILGNRYAQQMIRRALRSGQLTNLQRLDLHGNHLTALPAELGQLTNLTTLILDANQLNARRMTRSAPGRSAP